jgi:hypothetical protein
LVGTSPYSGQKVDKILKSSLDLIPSPSPLVNQKVVGNPQQCFAFILQANFPAHNLNFSLKVKVMGWNPDYLLKFFLTLTCQSLGRGFK